MRQEYLDLGQIRIDFPLSYQFIKEISIQEDANEHSTLRMKLVVNQSIDKEDILRLSEVPVKVYAGEESCLYSGICLSADLHKLNSYNELILTAKSWSYQADIRKNNRTFQNPAKTLNEVVEAVLAPYGFAVSLQKDIPISIMLSQQKETDWEFVRRIANQFGFLVFADSKSEKKRISIGVVSFGEEELPEETFDREEKDILTYCKTKSRISSSASAYEFLKQGCQTADLSLGTGYILRGGKSRQVVTQSRITANQGLVVNWIMLSYVDGAYPPADSGGTVLNGGSSGNACLAQPTASSGLTVNGSSVISGRVIEVSGTNVQVEFLDGKAGGIRWIPYCSMLGNDFYCMPDVDDQVYCYYENDGTVVCLGSRHRNTDHPDFFHPEEKVLTANNRMIRLKADGLELSGNRRELDGNGGEQIRITFSDKEGIEISASKEVNIRADRALLIQSHDLEAVKEQPTEWFDSGRKKRQEEFDTEQAKGNDRYVTDGGDDSYFASWELVKAVGGNILKGFADDISAPFQLINTLGAMGASEETHQDPPRVSFDKVDEHQVMILGLASCTLQVPGSYVRFTEDSIVMKGPDLWWFGFNRRSDYFQHSQSQQTLMDSIMDAVQLGIDIVGMIPGCNVVCGALNAGISLLRGDYYGALSGLMGMCCPGGGLVTRGLGMLADASDAAKVVIKGLKVLKSGALMLNAALLGSQDLKELIRRWESNELSFTDPEDWDLLVSLGRNAQTAFQSGKDIYDEVKPKKPAGDTNPNKRQDSDTNKKNNKDTDTERGDGAKQKNENQKCDNDPIDVVTGSQKIVQTELVVRDVAESFKLQRTYQSIHTNKGGLLGSKWYLNIESWITIEGDGAVIILPDMHLEYFTRKEEGWINNREADEAFRLEEDREGYCLHIQKERKRYFYNRAGKLIRIADRNGNTTFLRYAQKTLVEVTFQGGQCLKFSYEDGKVSSITDVIGRKVQYHYDGELLTEVEYPNMGVIAYSYTPEGYIRTITDQNGHVYVQNEYDLQGRVTRQILANGQEYIMLYDESRRINTFLTPASGKKIEYHYNQDRLLIRTVYTDGTVEERDYDHHQNLNYLKDRRGGELYRSFNDRGELLKEQLPNGLITQYAYDEEGNLLQEWDNAGRKTEFSYDRYGNRILVRAALDEHSWQETGYVYDERGRILSIIDPRGGKSQARYEEKGTGMVFYQTPEGYEWQYAYDPAGRCMAVKGEEGGLEYAYNQMDYVARVTDALGNTTRYEYDGLCNLIGVMRPNQYAQLNSNPKRMRYIYDAMDELICRIDPLGNVYARIRDKEENVIREIHPNSYDPKTGEGEGIGYAYDGDDNRIKIYYPDGGIERRKYDPSGNLLKKIAPQEYNEKTDDGPGFSYAYDEVNRLVQITDPEGRILHRYVYDLCGNIIKEMDARGCALGETDEERIGTLYTYNGVGWLTGKREPVEEKEGEIYYRLTEYVHDASGNMTEERRYLDFQTIDSKKGAIHRICFTYDKDNRRTCVSDSTGAVVEYRYNSRNQCVRERKKVREDLFQLYRYEYDEAGRMVSILSFSETAQGIRPRGKTRFTYDGNGNCTRIRLPAGGEILREYDEADRLVAEEHRERRSGIKNRIRFGYDKAGNLVEIQDNQGRKTTLEYDRLNREIKRIERDGSVTRSFYNPNGYLVRQIRPNQYQEAGEKGLGYQYSYDHQGRVITLLGPDGHVLTQNIYDGDGNLLGQLDGLGEGTEYAYNLLGEPIHIRTTGGSGQRYELDARGNIIGVEEGNHNRTRYRLDDWGRIVEIQKADGSKEGYGYDCAGNLVSATDGEGHTTRYSYDGEGNLVSLLDPMGAKEEYVYDEEGRLIQKTDRKGVITEYAYTLYGAPLYRRVKGREEGDFYRYTPEGLLRSALSQSPEGSMCYSYGYDALDRLIQKSASGRTLLAYGYDGNGNRIRQRDVTGKETEYVYDACDRLREVWEEGRRLASYAYQGDGRIREESHGPLRKEYAYDKEKNLTGLTLWSGDRLLADNQYRYDGNGNLILKKQLSGETRYFFDPLNQLRKVEYPSYGEELFYDRAGNRTRRIADGVEEGYQYDAGNRLTALIRKGKRIPFRYDEAGNLLQDDRAEYSYDAFNRTVRVETFDGHIQINRYDAEGLRHELEEDGKLVQFIFNPDRQVVTEVGTEKIRYIRGRELIASDAERARTYYHYASNELGSITHLTDEAGEVLNHYEYDAWGNRVECEERVANRFAFTGEQLDPVTQQYYLRARYYNPVIARFTQEDTYRGDGLNLYAYCQNNPVRYVDPSGHMVKCQKNAYEQYRKEGRGAALAYTKATGKDPLKPIDTASDSAAGNRPKEPKPEVVKPGESGSNTVYSYDGVKQASEYLQSQGVPRAYRKQILESFDVETIKLQTAGDSTYGLRFYGGNANAEGRYLFETFSPLTNRQNLALPYEWNSMTGIQQFQVRSGTTMITGKAAAQKSFGSQYIGGANQWYINNLEDLIKCR